MAKIIWKSKKEIETEKIMAKIEALKNRLNETDYMIIKASEYQLLGLEIPYDMESLHTERQTVRDKINELEELI